MDQSRIDLGIDNLADESGSGIRRAMEVNLPAGWFYAVLIIAVTVWILHSFVHALLAACVTAMASWPLYRKFAARLPRRAQTCQEPFPAQRGKGRGRSRGSAWCPMKE